LVCVECLLVLLCSTILAINVIFFSDQRCAVRTAIPAGKHAGTVVSPADVHLFLSDDEGENDHGLPSAGDEFMAVKPWLGAIVAPSAWSNPDPAKVDPFYAALGEMSAQHRRLPEEGVTPEGAKGELGAWVVDSARGLAVL
jgi:hypothetical protein